MSSIDKIAEEQIIFVPPTSKVANIVLFQGIYHIVNLTSFKFSTRQFFWRLAAQKIAGEMIQEDGGKRSQPEKT